MAGGEVAYFLCNAESGVQYAFVSMRAALGIPLKKNKNIQALRSKSKKRRFGGFPVFEVKALLIGVLGKIAP